MNSVTDISTTEYTAFDILGRVTSHKQTTDGNDYTTGYTYSLSGQLLEQEYPGGRIVKNTYDAADGSISQVQSKRSAETYRNFANGFVYNSAGAATAMRLGNGKWENTVFNSRMQPTKIGLGTGVASQDLLKLEYEYGATASVNNGNVTKQTITVPGVAQPFIQTYTYDELNRLTNAEEIKNSVQQWEQTFTYDRFGNRNFNEAETTTLPKNCGSAPSFTVCAADKKIVNPSVNTANNRLSTSDNYAFDNAGNTTADAEGRTFVYDAENKQIQVIESSVTVGEYWYDGDGKRIKKRVPAVGATPEEITIFVYDAGGKLIQEHSTIVQEEEDAKTAFPTSDSIGSPRINTDGTGQVISRHDYHPFGEEVDRTSFSYGSDTIRKQFTGYERDGETGLDFAQARMYANRLGRFTAIDPLMVSASPDSPQSWNRYIYVLNNPLVMIDPTGEMADYYDADDGSYLGNDGIDDHKVKIGKEISRTESGGKIYRRVNVVDTLNITDTEFNRISNVLRAEGGTNDASEYLWLAHTANNCLQTNCQSNPGGTLLSLLSTQYSTAPAEAKTELSPENGSTRANAARAGLIHVLTGGADPTGGATFWDGTDFILRGRSHPKFAQNDSIVIREEILGSYISSQGASSLRLNGRRYANPNPFFAANKGSWTVDGKSESGFLYRSNSGRGILYATGAVGQSIFWTRNIKWTK